MSSLHTQPPAHIRDLLDELRRLPGAGPLRDREFRRRRAFEVLAQHPDPVLREIGEQLRDGAMRPTDILRLSVYSEAFQSAAEQARDQLSPDLVAHQLEQAVAQRRAEERRTDPEGPRRAQP